jgi:hypothetical protein
VSVHEDDGGGEVRKLAYFGMSVELGPPDPERPGAFTGGALSSQLSEGRMAQGVRGEMRGIERMVLACACAGIEVGSPAFCEAVETAVEAAANQA